MDRSRVCSNCSRGAEEDISPLNISLCESFFCLELKCYHLMRDKCIYLYQVSLHLYFEFL